MVRKRKNKYRKRRVGSVGKRHWEYGVGGIGMKEGGGRV